MVHVVSMFEGYTTDDYIMDARKATVLVKHLVALALVL